MYDDRVFHEIISAPCQGQLYMARNTVTRPFHGASNRFSSFKKHQKDQLTLPTTLDKAFVITIVP